MGYFIGAFLEMVKFYLFFRFGGRVQVRQNKKLCIAIAAILWVVYSYICFVIKGENPILYLIWLFFELVVIFKYNFGKLVVLSIGTTALIGMLDGLSLIAIELAHTILHIGMEQQVGNILADIVTLLFFIVLYKCILKKGNISFRDIGIRRLGGIFVIGFIYTLILAVIWNEVLDWEMRAVSAKVYTIFFLVIISAYYQIGILLELAISNKELEKKDITNRHFLELQEKQYIYLKDTEQETKKFRHDMKQHIFIIAQLCKNNDMTKVEKYITETWGILGNLSAGACVNNSIVDAILNQYFSLCQKSEIEFSVKGHMPPDCKIVSYDICTLFSNLLQNGYEATLLCKSKRINIIIRYDKKNIYIQQNNTYNGSILTNNGKIMTSKEDNLSHGFGLENIEKCIKKYKGSFEFRRIDEEEKMISIQIILQNKSPKGE